jgi:argininosuccinate lyase
MSRVVACIGGVWNLKGVYRSRFKKGLSEATSNFISSLAEDERIFDYDVMGTMAHNIMLYEQRILSLDDLRAILHALQEIRGRSDDAKHGGFEDVHEFLESEVISSAGMAKGGKVHTARSRNDQVVVAMRMRIRSDILDLCESILGLMKAALSLAERNAESIMPLYTHTQRAQVGTFGHYLLSQLDALARDFDRLMGAYARVNLNPLGACAIGGTSFPIDRRRTSELLGFEGLVENSIDAVSSRDFVLEVVGAIAVLMTDLSRIAEDLIVWSTSEFSFTVIADEYASPSSFMPQKKNPCSLELVRARAARTYGCLMNVLAVVKGLPTGYNRDLQDMKPPLWASFDTASASLDILTGVLSTLRVNRRRMREAAEAEFLMAVDLAELIVQKYGLSFREAHGLVGAMVKRSLATGRRLSELRAEEVRMISASSLGEEIGLSRSFISTALNPRRCLRRRESTGSPSPIEMRRMLRARKVVLRRRWMSLNAHRQTLASSEKRLSDTVKRYMGER